jgi:deoxyribonucleoside regulator
LTNSIFISYNVLEHNFIIAQMFKEKRILLISIDKENLRLIIKVSSLYYLDGLNQQEIADRLRISRPQVSRMLSTAKAEGIVTITIKNPYIEEQQYEQTMADTFGIRDVIAIDSDLDAKMADYQLALAGAALLDSVLKDNDIVGVMAGKSIDNLVNEIQYFSRKGLQFIPLIGGWGPEGKNWHSNSNVRVLGEKLKSRFWQLNAPAVVATSQTREALLHEPEIAKVLDLARNCTLALVGIGQVSEQATIVQSGFFSAADINEVKAKKAVANICASFLDETGNVVDFPLSNRIIGLTIQEIRKIPRVIAIARGKEKVAAILAALRGHWIDVLLTDLETTKLVLEWHRSHPTAIRN